MGYPSSAVREPFEVKCLDQAAKAVKNAAHWSGRQIVRGFELLGEKIKTLWQNFLPYLKFAGLRIFEFLRTAPGIALMTGLLGVSLQVSAEMATKCNKYARLALRILAGIAFLGTGFTIGVGLAYGFHVPLI